MDIINTLNLKDEFLKLYIKEASYEQLKYIEMLLDQDDYKQIDAIIERFKNKIIYNEDLKDFGIESPSGKFKALWLKFEENAKDMDPESLELYYILLLIDAYVKENDAEKKELLDKEIQIAIERYRNPEERTPGKSR